MQLVNDSQISMNRTSHRTQRVSLSLSLDDVYQKDETCIKASCGSCLANAVIRCS